MLNPLCRSLHTFCQEGAREACIVIPVSFLQGLLLKAGKSKNENVLLKNYWNFSFSISPSNKYSGLISFRMDWLDLLAVQVTLKGLLQHHSSKASIFDTQLSFFLFLVAHSKKTLYFLSHQDVYTFFSKN